MKVFFKNILATTGLTLLVLSAMAMMYDAQFIFISSVFQSWMANLIIHGGLLLLRRFENRYVIVEITAEAAWVLAVVIICGHFFRWYESTPIPVLIVLGTAVYFIGILTDLLQISNDVSTINQQIQLRKERTCKQE